MILNISINPGEITNEYRMMVNTENFLPYTAAYVDVGTYCTGIKIDNGIEFSAGNDSLYHNLQIGRYNSFADNIECVFGRNHNYKKVNTGALDLALKKQGATLEDGYGVFTQKGTTIIQNDVWVGANVTIMPGVVIRNGAVIARNAHVVSDVPPYAIVGGNPAKVIGYRFSETQIEKLQKIAWWTWEAEKLRDNATYFGEDIEAFCEKFYPDAEARYQEIEKRCIREEDAYFAFVDYYENYSCYATVLEQFLDRFIGDDTKKLILFVQERPDLPQINPQIYDYLQNLIDEISVDDTIKCSVEIKRGDINLAKSEFEKSSHYIVSRTYDTVDFSCIADLLKIEIISGVDSNILF